MKAICRMCVADAPEAEVYSQLVCKNQTEKQTALGAAMLDHMGKYHFAYMSGDVVGLARLFNGFLVMNQFDLEDEKMIEDVENMRDLLADKVMEYSDEVEDEEEGDENSEDDNEDEEDDGVIDAIEEGIVGKEEGEVIDIKSEVIK